MMVGRTLSSRTDTFIRKSTIFNGAQATPGKCCFSKMFATRTARLAERVGTAPNSAGQRLHRSRSRCCDFDGDGKLDVLLTTPTPASPLRNVTQTTNHWITKLIGDPAKTLRGRCWLGHFAVVNGMKERLDVVSGAVMRRSRTSVFILPRLSDQIDKLEIHWPNGDIETIAVPAIDKLFIIRQGKGVVAK